MTQRERVAELTATARLALGSVAFGATALLVTPVATAEWGIVTIATDLLGRTINTILGLAAITTVVIMLYGLFRGMLMGMKDPKAHKEGLAIFRQALVVFVLMVALRFIVGWIQSTAQGIDAGLFT